MSNELAEFLEEAPAQEEATETPEVTETPTEEPPQEEPKAEQEETTVEEEGSPTEPEKPKDVPLSALLDERDKRQSAVKRADELQAQIDKLNTPAKEAPDVLDDQPGFVNSINETTDQKLRDSEIKMSHLYAQRAHADFNEKFPLVEAFLNSNPDALRQTQGSVDPYGEAFILYERNLEVQRVSDPDYLVKQRASIKDEVRKEVEAEMKTEQEAKGKKDDLGNSISPSLADQSAAGSNKAVAAEVKDPLETTFNR